MAVMACLLNLLLLILGCCQVSSQKWSRVTMYHVNPRKYGPVPVNMDTGDPSGDLFFELFQVLTVPLACADKHVDRKSFNCHNPEAYSPTDVVNKITLEVRDGFSAYAMCNIGRNGTDGLGHRCKDDTYCCVCGTHNFTHWPPPQIPCKATVGKQNILEHFGGGSHWRRCTKDYECWEQRASAHLTAQQPGYWYSPLSYGDCSLHHNLTANCTWRLAQVDKIVSKQCHSNSFFGAVQHAAPECFEDCPRAKGGANASDPCWVRCFYKAVLGPTSGEPTGNTEGGLDWSEVVRFWEAPFESEDPAKGGCPSLPVPPPQRAHDLAAALSPRQRSRRQFRYGF